MKWIIGTALLLTGFTLRAQTDTIRPGSPKLQTKWLKPGLKQYLVYYQDKQKNRVLDLSIWLREVRTTTQDDREIFTVRQQWFSHDSLRYRTFFSVSDHKDFSPRYHTATAPGKVYAYNWNAAEVTGTDTVSGNLVKGFHLSLDKPAFNWNLDIETFEMLPLAAGKTFLINFYDAGYQPPALVTYTVTGSEQLITLDNQTVDCWKLSTESSHKGVIYKQTFWISKKQHELLKEEDVFGGMFRYKVKLPLLSPELLSRFNPH